MVQRKQSWRRIVRSLAITKRGERHRVRGPQWRTWTHSNSCAQTRPAAVPRAYPRTPSRTPTGARAGWKAAATTGADAAPPMLAWEPTAMQKIGARSSQRRSNNTTAWIVIQTPAIASSDGNLEHGGKLGLRSDGSHQQVEKNGTNLARARTLQLAHRRIGDSHPDGRCDEHLPGKLAEDLREPGRGVLFPREGLPRPQPWQPGRFHRSPERESSSRSGNDAGRATWA